MGSCRSSFLSVVFASLVASFLCGTVPLEAQCGALGRIFFAQPETIALWEFDSFPGVEIGEVVFDGTVVQDLSGNGLDAFLEESNRNHDLRVDRGDPAFSGSDIENLVLRRFKGDSTSQSLVVRDDGDAFEFDGSESFTIEVYLERVIQEPILDFGVLLGTFRTRNLLDDTQDLSLFSAAYGYGLFFWTQRGWSWSFSGVVDGEPFLGFPNVTGADSERFTNPWFDIPEGHHYLVFVMDRDAQQARGYLDGDLITSFAGLDPKWEFVTPTNYDHAAFRMFSALDDPTRNTFRGSPAGYNLDAVHVLRGALPEDDIRERWSLISGGKTVGESSTTTRAVIDLSDRELVVGQCVELDARGSCVAPGAEIVSYEWKTGDGGFEVGGATCQVSLDVDTGPRPVSVTLRIVDSEGRRSSVSVPLRTESIPVAAIAQMTVESQPDEPTSAVARGASLTLDGTQSHSLVPPGVLQCPLEEGLPVVSPEIVSYSWDLGDDGVEDSSQPTFQTGSLASVGELPIRLTVMNALGSEASTVSVVNVLQTFLRADANDDASADISDALTILNYLFTDTGSPISCLEAADANDDGEIDISDAVSVLNWLFFAGGVAPPPPPGPPGLGTCGIDSTEPKLGCAAFDACSGE